MIPLKSRVLVTAMLLVINHILSQEKIRVTGFVFDDGNPISSVLIKNKNSTSSTITNQEGRYEIELSPNDTLEFSHIGYQDEIRIIKPDRITLNVSMNAKTIELDEVTVSETVRWMKSNRELELDYSTNPDLIKTQFGIIDKKNKRK